MSSLREALSTLLASERLLSSVNTYVDFKPFILCEAPSTLLACVWLLSSVNSHVDFRTPFFSETLSTCMHEFMHKASLQCEFVQ